MLIHLLILFAGIVLGFNLGVIVYALCLARRNRRPAPPPAERCTHRLHIVTTAELNHDQAQRVAAHWHLQ